MERLYPLLPLQNAIFTDITAALSARKRTLEHHQSSTQNTATWEKFRVLLGKPGTAKSQVLTRAIDHAIRTDMSVLVAAPVAEYAKFLDFIRVLLPIQQQVNEMQRGIVLCPKGQLSDEDIWEAYRQHSDSTIMTVLRKAAQRINDIIIRHLFPGRPISNIPCASVANTNAIFPHKQMQVIFTENQDKAARVVNGQQATILGCENHTIILSLPEGWVFAYQVTHMDNDVQITRYPFTPAYVQTITKSQGRNIRHLIIWLDSDLVPPGTGYIGLSRVRTRSSISFLRPIPAHQLMPVEL